jgi:hypothetical protein
MFMILSAVLAYMSSTNDNAFERRAREEEQEQERERGNQESLENAAEGSRGASLEEEGTPEVQVQLPAAPEAAPAPEAVEPEAVAPEAVAPEAVAPEAPEAEEVPAAEPAAPTPAPAE